MTQSERAVPEGLVEELRTIAQYVCWDKFEDRFTSDPKKHPAWRAADALEALARELAEARALAKKLSDALVTVRPLGGSELFMRVGEEFFADPIVCTAEIERLRADLHETKTALFKERRARTALSNGEPNDR